MKNWITTDLTSLLAVALTATLVYAAIILYCRLTGLRSFSKMSAPDFAMTVAVGSLFAATISSPDPTLILGIFALGWLFLGQWVVAVIRRKFDGASEIIDNTPLLLMRGDTILDGNLSRANVTRSDLMSKLREANVHNFSQVRAVVFEATGDVTVLHTSEENSPELEQQILADVIGWDESPAH